jgi:hypothetical protein
MSSIQTDEEALTVDSLESVQQEEEVLARQDESETAPGSWSFSASLKKSLQRFVHWINHIDEDGQEYWN